MSIDEPTPHPEKTKSVSRQEMARHTRRSFLIGGIAAAAVFGAYDWLDHAPRIGELRTPLRDALRFNAALSRALFSNRQLAPAYPSSRLTGLRLNNDVGLNTDMLLDSWRLQVVGLENPRQYPQFIEDVALWKYRSKGGNSPLAQPSDGNSGSDSKSITMHPIEIHQTLNIPLAPPSDKTRIPGIVLSMTDLRKLPFTEQITQFKCIEGWSQITSFGGLRFADFVKAYPPARHPDGSYPRYVLMETANGLFSSAFDFADMLHPQTMLCYKMHGQSLTPGHGAPLRLATPFHYGYKQIKQIARLTYTDKRPLDYWSRRGYDWYAGL